MCSTQSIHIHVHLRLEDKAGCPLSLLSYDCEAGPSTEPGPKLMVSKTLQIFLSPAYTQTWVIGVCDFLCGCWEFKSGSHAYSKCPHLLSYCSRPSEQVCRVFHLFASESRSPKECWDHGHVYPTMPGLYYNMSIFIYTYYTQGC